MRSDAVVKRDVARLKAEVGGLPHHEDASAEEVSLSAFLEEQDAIRRSR